MKNFWNRISKVFLKMDEFLTSFEKALSIKGSYIEIEKSKTGYVARYYNKSSGVECSMAMGPTVQDALNNLREGLKGTKC